MVAAKVGGSRKQNNVHNLEYNFANYATDRDMIFKN